jgi:hypothetical protein
VPQNVGDFFDRCTTLDHSAGGCVTEDVRPGRQTVYSTTFKGSSHDVANQAPGYHHIPWRPVAEEQVCFPATRTTVAKVSGQGLSDTLGQRQNVAPPGLGSGYPQDGLSPVNISQPQMSHLAGTQSQIQHTQGHGIVALACGCRTIKRFQESLGLIFV